MPNAGKSTFLAAVSAAKPKIADYPFTTLHPQLGVVDSDGREFVLADIPGLIEGAHEGIGLGDRFLGHVERCRVLLHLVDGTSEHAGEAYKTVRAELEAYGEGLGEKPEIVALNKADALTPEQLKQQTARLKRAAKKTPLVISAATGAGVPAVLRALLQVIDQGRREEQPSAPVEAWQPRSSAGPGAGQEAHRRCRWRSRARLSRPRAAATSRPPAGVEQAPRSSGRCRNRRTPCGAGAAI